ncbi:MAG: MMPL family transporter [Elusimicrobia bacterium]|nr:MMPL family transporter [Elusimicrobiota bacterium]
MPRLLTGAFWGGVYDALFLTRPRLTLLLAAALVASCGYFLKDFRMDASSDQLVLEHDEDVVYFRHVIERFGSGDFVVVTYTPPEDLFEDASLERLKRLREALKVLPRVSSVVTILDAPLLKNPAGTLKELKDNIKTLESPSANKKLAIIEFRDSPIYQGNLVSADLKSCAIQVNFQTDSALDELTTRRYALREKRRLKTIAPAELEQLASVEREHRHMTDEHRSWRHEDIAAIRRVITGFSGEARIYLGGVPMIVDDIISYIKKDVGVFGVGMVLYLVCLLALIFKDARYAALPLATSVLSVVMMMGILGFWHWDITIVSSNFISLQLVFTIEIGVHLVMRYRELLRDQPERPNLELVKELVHSSFEPIFYAILTTIAGFASLVFCDVVPIVSFGWMMSLGLCITLGLAYVLIPPILLLMPRSKLPPVEAENEFGHRPAMFLARISERHPIAVYAVSAVLAALTIAGCMRLEVENSFISYFKKSTDISQGMRFIDLELGGTTPVDIILNFDKPEPAKPAAARPPADDEFSGFEEFDDRSQDPGKYWFTAKKLETIEKVHDYLDGLEATGKVMSLGTAWKVAKGLNGGKAMDDFGTALLFNSMPGRTKEVLIDPYVSVADGQARVTTRIRDSMDHLRRDALLKQIKKDLVEKVGLKPEEFRVSGLMVLYNNLLQSLYVSQIKTIGFSTLSLFPMFLLFFRSVPLSLLVIVPNFIASMVVLGVMGLAGIPLDVMTITIVAIVVGIAVDNTMHYLHRFEEEFHKDRDYRATMLRCHGSIGHAMLYATLTNATGFCILALSNFIPTILFGTLTAFALAVALLMSLTLLPLLVIHFKPYGPEGAAAGARKGGHG